jgi:hypothetical protein
MADKSRRSSWATMNSSRSCSASTTFRPFMSQLGTFDISSTSSSNRSSSIDKGDGVWLSRSSFEPNSSAVSCSHLALVGEVGISEALGYVIISTSSDNSGAQGCRSSSRVTERIFSRINFPSVMSYPDIQHILCSDRAQNDA